MPVLRLRLSRSGRRSLNPAGETMTRIFTALVLSLLSVNALAASCKNEASDKHLAGAALTSFMGKCEHDARTSCATSASERKLSGAARTSFTQKCINDAIGD
jgi:hypothetical protein